LVIALISHGKCLPMNRTVDKTHTDNNCHLLHIGLVYFERMIQGE
jgi:hypothetical protein